MFKEFRIVKLLIGLILLSFLILEWNKGIENSSILYTDNPSYFNSSEVKIPLPSPMNVSIKNLTGLEVYNGLSNDFLNTNFPSGIYSINNQFPLVIKNKKETDITVVFPYLNNLLYESKNDTQYVNSPEDTLTMESTSSITEVDFGLFGFLNAAGRKFNVITEVDLLEKGNWINSKCLVVYGKTKFYSGIMNDHLIEYVQSGGNILLITSSYYEYEFSFDLIKKTIVKVRDSSGNIQIPRNKIPVYESYGGEAISEFIDFKTGQDQSKKIPVVSRNWCGFFNLKENYLFDSQGEILISSKSNSKLKSEIGIIKLLESSGSIYFIGSEDVLLDVNLKKKEWRDKLNEIVDGLVE